MLVISPCYAGAFIHTSLLVRNSVKDKVLRNLWEKPAHSLRCDTVHLENWIEFVRKPQYLHVETGHCAGLYRDFAYCLLVRMRVIADVPHVCDLQQCSR